MNLSIIARVLWLRRGLRAHERWTRAELADHQRTQLEILLRFAQERSTFYQRFHRGLVGRPLGDLPVLTKATLMDNFDEIATNGAVRLTDANEYLASLKNNDLFRGKYWVSATSGSSGRKSVIASDVHEWAAILASYARANEWAGIQAGLTHRVTIAVVSSTTPWHQSSRVAATLQSPFVITERFDAGRPLREIVEALNAMRPGVLVAYASMIRVLAQEQLAGRLRIAPRAVNCSSEVLTGEARALAERAFRVAPFNVYAATESGGIAADCERHMGMHLFEDLLIPEVVDEANRPVPDGETGAKLLVTVFSSRTLPLIRYELTDRVRLSTERCPCGRPFRLVAEIEGRTDDVLQLVGLDGRPVEVHPLVFHRVFDGLPIAGWQVRQVEGGLQVNLAGRPGDVVEADVVDALKRSLAGSGARSGAITLHFVAGIDAGAAGKRPMIVALKRSAVCRPARHPYDTVRH